ncbi:MAG: hypothetical protein RI885_1501, partial [Actinomycetota bacterium]
MCQASSQTQGDVNRRRRTLDHGDDREDTMPEFDVLLLGVTGITGA